MCSVCVSVCETTTSSMKSDIRPVEALLLKNSHQEHQQNTLAQLMTIFRQLLQHTFTILDALINVPTFKFILKSTQLAHVLMLVAVFFMSSAVLQLSSVNSTSPLTNLAYITSHSIHFGNQFWMTFISGVALFFNLPRHDFGAVQKVLFPKYFTLNSCLSFLTLISFTNLHHWTDMRNTEILQVAALCACFLLELGIRLYAVPSVIHLITEKTNLEIRAGVGREVGQFEPGPLRACPHYTRLHKRFRKQHTMVAVGNIAAMACTSLHLYYLAFYRQSCICSSR